MSHKLTPRQVRAAHLMVRGMSAVEIATELKLRRETLSRWKRNPEFSKEMERVVQDMRESLKFRLTRLVDSSITAVHSNLFAYQSDPKRLQIALNVLKALGKASIVYPEPPILSDK